MKKRWVTLLLTFLLTGPATADIVLPGSHGVSRNVYVINVEEYPEIALLNCVLDLMGYGDAIRCYRLEGADAVLEKGYKFNRHYLLAMPKALLESYGGLDATSLSEIHEEELAVDFNKLIEKKEVPSWPYSSGGVYVDDKYRMTRESLYYQIVEATEENLTVKLVKRIVGYSDGTPDTVIEY